MQNCVWATMNRPFRMMMKNEKKNYTAKILSSETVTVFLNIDCNRAKKTKTISLVRITTHSIFFLCFSALALGFVLKLDELDREI